MNMSSPFVRLLVRPAILALAVSAASLVPSVHAQAPQTPPAEPPVTSADATEFQAAMALYNAKNWDGAMQSLEAFRNKYANKSPRSLEAKYWLGRVYIEKKMYDDAAREFRQLLADPKTKEVDAKQELQLLVAQSLMLKGSTLPEGTDVQKGMQAKAYEEAIAEFDKFLTQFPTSKSVDAVEYYRATLLMIIAQYDEAVKGYAKVAGMQSSLKVQAQLYIGKARWAQASILLTGKEGKEPKPDDVKQALLILDSQAYPAFDAAYRDPSRDLAIMNEAVLYVGQIRLTKHQHAPATEDPAKQDALLGSALDAFRAVRSREEVVGAQEAKITALTKQIELLDKTKADYLATRAYYEGLIKIEEETKTRFMSEQDQFLAARLAIARIFILQNKLDECRVLVRYLQGQKEIFEKEKAARAEVANILGVTYIKQNNVAKGIEAWEAFRKEFNTAAGKGDSAGEGLPVLVADILVRAGGDVNIAKASEIIEEGRADYKPWRFESDALQVLVGVLSAKKDFAKAVEVIKKNLAGPDLKPEAEIEMRMNLANLLRSWAFSTEVKQPEKAKEALVELNLVRQKFGTLPRAEDAWFDKASTLESLTDHAAALTEYQSFIDKYKDGGGKSENTAKNVPLAQFQLARVLASQTKPKLDDAVKAYRTLLEKWPDSEPAPTAYFRIFDIENGRGNFAAAKKAMEDFLQKYPKHENVYYAYSYQATMLFDAKLRIKPGQPPPQPSIDDLTAGTKKMLEYVEYEMGNQEVKEKKGPDALLTVSGKWNTFLPKGPYLAFNGDTKLTWQKCIDQILSLNELLLKNYPKSSKLAESIDKLAGVQKVMLAAKVIDQAKGEAYFNKLIAQYALDDEVKNQLLLGLASFVQEYDAKKAQGIRQHVFDNKIVGPAPTSPDKPQTPEAPTPTASPDQWDHRLADLFSTKEYDKMTAAIAKIRTEYPLAKDEDTSRTRKPIYDAQANALFWEAKILGAQGKTTDAGALFQDLAKRFSKSPKVLEADYGIILGKLDLNPPQIEKDWKERLQKVVNRGETFELRAQALFLSGRILEAQGNIEEAIKTFTNVAFAFKSVKVVAAEALWRGAELLRKQATGEIKVETVKEARDAAIARAKERTKEEAEKAKADAEKKKTEEAKPKADGKAGETKSGEPAKPGETKAADPAKPGETKTADPAKPGDPAKPAEKTTAKTEGEQK